MSYEPTRKLFTPHAYAERIAELTDRFLRANADYVAFAIASDPALRDLDAAAALDQLQSYPGVRALAAHHAAHAIYDEAMKLPADQRGDLLTQARYLSQAAQAETGIDIHPGATLDPKTFLDHGTGVVIGEQAKIGRGTRMYHDVTLGAAGRPPEDAPRHPQVGEHCLISVDVKILGHVVAGNGVTFGPRATVQGNNLTIGNEVKIGTSAQIGDHNDIADGVTIGAGAVIPNGVGRIDRNVPAFSKVLRGVDGELYFEAHSPSPKADVSISAAL